MIANDQGKGYKKPGFVIVPNIYPDPGAHMQKPPLGPDVTDIAPTDAVLTAYDHDHLVTYMRLLDADADGADWRDVARIVLRLDPRREPDRAWRTYDTHLERARWMTEQGYRQLLRAAASR